MATQHTILSSRESLRRRRTQCDASQRHIRPLTQHTPTRLTHRLSPRLHRSLPRHMCLTHTTHRPLTCALSPLRTNSVHRSAKNVLHRRRAHTSAHHSHAHHCTTHTALMTQNVCPHQRERVKATIRTTTQCDAHTPAHSLTLIVANSHIKKSETLAHTHAS